MVHTTDLIAETISDTSVPVIAAGGMMDGPSILQAFRAGAKAVQLGTAFIASPESGAAPAYKDALKQNRLKNTVLSRAFTGRWARVINNDFILELEKDNIPIPPFPIQAGLTAPIRIVAQKTDNAQFMPLFAGMSAIDPSQAPAGEILLDLIRQSERAAAAGKSA
jgi:nitronate monooxygenase